MSKQALAKYEKENPPKSPKKGTAEKPKPAEPTPKASNKKAGALVLTNKKGKEKNSGASFTMPSTFKSTYAEHQVQKSKGVSFHPSTFRTDNQPPHDPSTIPRNLNSDFRNASIRDDISNL
jgi:hypothetical protein